MNWLTAHWAHIVGGGSAGIGGAAFFGVVFRDGIKEWWAERKEERRAARTAKALQDGKGDAVGTALVSVLREELGERGKRDERVVQVLEVVKDILVRLETKQDTQGKQLDLMHQRVITIQGAVGRVQ
jgi:hypothetical protein